MADEIVVGDAGGKPEAYVLEALAPLMGSPEARKLAEYTVHWLRNGLVPVAGALEALDGKKAERAREAVDRILRLADAYNRALRAGDE